MSKCTTQSKAERVGWARPVPQPGSSNPTLTLPFMVPQEHYRITSKLQGYKNRFKTLHYLTLPFVWIPCIFFHCGAETQRKGKREGLERRRIRKKRREGCAGLVGPRGTCSVAWHACSASVFWSSWQAMVQHQELNHQWLL